MTEDIDVYRRHTVCSDPGRMADWLSSTPSDLASLRRLSTGLVFHYTANGDPLQHGFTGERMAEIDLRYADEQFARLAELTPGLPIGANRQPTERILGCCRDFSLLLVSMLRSRGFAARSRVGFAGYFEPGWWIDHVVVEVYDEDTGSWRLVEAQTPDGFVGVGGPLDPLDLPRDRFLTGDSAWRAAREGRNDPSTFVVSPSLEIPVTRSWPELAHHLVQDLTSLTGWEPVLWDVWGVLDSSDVDDVEKRTELISALDAVAAAIASGASLAELRRLAENPLFALPGTIGSFSPRDGNRRPVELRARRAV